MSAQPVTTFEKWIDRPVVDNDGHRIGIVADVYIDDASGYPEWLAIMTGLFGSRLSFVPVTGAVLAGERVSIAFPKAFVKDSPNIDTDGTLTVEEEQRLYRHYGMRYSTLKPSLVEKEQATPIRRRLRRKSEKSPQPVDLRTPR